MPSAASRPATTRSRPQTSSDCRPRWLASVVRRLGRRLAPFFLRVDEERDLGFVRVATAATTVTVATGDAVPTGVAPTTGETGSMRPGDVAPAFDLPTQDGSRLSLGEALEKGPV